MANVFVQDHEMTAIANTLREVNNTDKKYLLSEIPDAIEEGVIKYANKKTVVGSSVAITDAADTRLIGLKVYGNERPSSNLLEYPRDYGLFLESCMIADSKSFCGIDWTLNTDGSITVNGTAYFDGDLILYPRIDLAYKVVNLIGADEWDEVNNQTWTKTVVFDVELSDESARDKLDIILPFGKLREPYLLTYENTHDEIIMQIELHEGETFDNVTIYPKLNLDSLKPWEACGVLRIENQITVSMSNDTETKNVVIPIDTLWGYKETKVGDSEARDYIDFERKKLVKYYNHEYVFPPLDCYRDMCGLFIMSESQVLPDDVNPYQCVLKNSTEYKRVTIDDIYSDACLYHTPSYVNDITTSGFFVNNPIWMNMSDEEVHAELAANPLVFVFPTYEPVEYDLTDEQIEAFEQMKTFYGNTTISTDCGAIMEITYVVNPESGVV